MTRMHPVNQVKARLASGELCCIMAIRQARTTDIVGIAAATGHHAFFIDLQHSTISEDVAAAICHAGLLTGVTPLVRLPRLDRAVAEHMLEAGALGLIVPDVRSAADAAMIARVCHFPPVGERSPISHGPHTGFRSGSQTDDRERLGRETILIAMLEREESIVNAAEIAAVPGVDALMIGTNDLTSSIGLYGEYEHPRVKELFATAIRAGGSCGKPVIAGGIRDARIVADYIAAGAACCFVTGTDTALLGAGAEAQVKAFQSIIDARQSTVRVRTAAGFQP